MTAPVHYSYYTPAGPITIEARGADVTRIVLGQAALAGEREPSAATNQAATQLQEYLARRRRTFTFAYATGGSAFQNQVWTALAQVPYGQTVTAARLAEMIGHAGAHRAVGSAVRANPLAIVVPAHRLVRAGGQPWGEGKPARIRGALLSFERAALAADGVTESTGDAGGARRAGNANARGAKPEAE